MLQMNTGQLIILLENPAFKTPPRASVHHGFMVTYEQYLRALERLPRLGFAIGDTRQQFRARGAYSIDVQDPTATVSRSSATARRRTGQSLRTWASSTAAPRIATASAM